MDQQSRVNVRAVEDDQRPGSSPVPARLDLRSAALLAGVYGVTGAVAALLLIPLVAQKTEVKLPLSVPAFAVVLAVQLTAIYGLMAWAGLRMARGRGLEPAPMLTQLWRGERLRVGWVGFGRGALTGLLVGSALVLAVKGITRAFPGALPEMLHPPSVLSALAASTAGSFGEEILCRLFLLSAVLRVIPREARWGRPAAAVVSSLAFGGLHTPGMVALYGGLAAVPAMAWVWVISLNALAGTVFAALYLRRGIGMAIAGHWFCDLAWHVGSLLA